MLCTVSYDLETPKFSFYNEKKHVVTFPVGLTWTFLFVMLSCPSPAKKIRDYYLHRCCTQPLP